jgi:hypothetical protein
MLCGYSNANPLHTQMSVARAKLLGFVALSNEKDSLLWPTLRTGLCGLCLFELYL